MPRVHFAFRDGALGYACARCDRRCCAGVWLTDRVADRPVPARMALFSRGSIFSPRLRVIEQVDEHCAYLAEDGLCSIHRDHGREAKPLACRLFPTAELHRFGRIDVVAVFPQAQHCPLEVVGGATDVTVLRHDEIRADLEACDEVPAAYSALPGAGWPVDFLELESDCRDAEPSAPDADYIDHMARQLVRAAYHLGGRATAELAVQDVANARADLLLHLGLAADLLAVTMPPALSAGSNRALVVMTGTLRLRVLAAMATASYETAIERVPFVLCALAWLAANHVAARREAGGRAGDLTPSEIARLWARYGNLALLLGHLYSVPYLETQTLGPDVPAGSAETLRRFVTAIAADDEARRAFVTVGIPDTQRPRLLKDYLGPLVREQPERSVLLRAVADHVALRYHAQ